MQTQDDDFPYSSSDPSLSPVEENATNLRLNSQQLGDLKASMRLVVGSSLNGWDAYIQRLRQLQAMQESLEPGSMVLDDDEGFRQSFRHLLLGVLFETPDFFRRLLVRADKTSSKAYGLFSKVVSPFTNSWVFSPVRNRYDYTAARGEKVIDRLVRKGRIEEQNSRLMTQQKAVDDLINDFLEYVILRTEATQIIQEGGIGMAGGAIDEFRDQSASVDTLLEQKLKSVFQKRTPPSPDQTPKNLSEGGK